MEKHDQRPGLGPLVLLGKEQEVFEAPLDVNAFNPLFGADQGRRSGEQNGGDEKSFEICHTESMVAGGKRSEKTTEGASDSLEGDIGLHRWEPGLQ